MSGPTLVELPKDNYSFGAAGTKLTIIGGIVGLLALGGAAAMGVAADDHLGRFLHAYLLAFYFVLTIALGCLFFVGIQYLFRSGWSVTVRRLAELGAGVLPVLAVLALPIIVSVAMGNHSLYPWTDHEVVSQSHLLEHKAPYLNLNFFLVRCVVYFAIWALLSWYFLSSSTKQDSSGDPKLTRRMEIVSGPATLLFALTLTFASIDFIMSLAPTWFSTMIGVYFFAGACTSSLSFLILFAMALQKSGRMTQVLNTEHYHDLGKLLFGFTFFWSYICFSQFMLIWYANIPEETEFYLHRFQGPWYWFSWFLLLGHWAFPMAGLLSRHVKRNRKGLAFFAVWLLVMHYVDIAWYVLPTVGGHDAHGIPFGPMEVLSWVGMVGIFLAVVGFLGSRRSLVPLKDPRVTEALSFENI
ncbi:MAG: quinol:cytochrome C oxidoreductase [Myxococcota bacterium]